MLPMSPQQKLIVTAFLTFVFVVTGAQAVLRSYHLYALANQPKPPPVACIGDPLPVDQDYGGGPIKEWSCKPSCDDGKQRYLVYKNGYATQCGAPPNCYDDGEDKGVTCEIPGKTVASTGSQTSSTK